MNKITILTANIALTTILLTGCGGIDVQQNTSAIEVGTETVAWEDMITVKEAEKYNVTCDASQVDANILGEYTVTYTFTNKENQKETTKDFTFKVEDTTAPEINLLDGKDLIVLGEETSPMDIVEIVDNYDGILTQDNVKIDSTLDVNQEGTYTINYIATDSSGNQSTKELNVTVQKQLDTEIKFGETLPLDFVEMSVLNSSWSDTIKPTDTSFVYSSMADQDNESYFWISGNLKNISGDKYNVENIVAEINFDEKYNYTAYLIADDGGSDFYGSSVKPMKSVKYYIYASVPDEIKNSYSTAKVIFGFKDKFSGSYYDNLDECDHIYSIQLKAQ